MNLRRPTPALVPVIALVVLGGIVATFMISRTLPSGAESSLAPAPLKKHAKPKPAVARKAKPKAKPATASRPKTKPVVVPVAPTAPVRKPFEAPKGDPVDAHGLPLVLARALRKQPVAVVALYDPRSAIDEMALAEARAGAADVKAAFVAISIRNEPQVRPLTQLLGVLETPAILVYERPNTLFVRIEGFSDRQTVAQAAVNARR